MSDVERVPWSELGPEFSVTWGVDGEGNPMPQHMEIIGMNGSGKTYFLCTVLQERMLVRDTPTIIIATKPADKTLRSLGWPIADSPKQLRQARQVIFWPHTNAIGKDRKEYLNDRIYHLLSSLWHPEANTIVAFDEIAYAESLSPDMRDIIEMYWREGRSQGITVVGMKQRPQGANRHMSSESWWTIAYPPKDHADKERFAELFGSKKEWLPILDSIDTSKREFLIRDARTQTAYISWVDLTLKPIKPSDTDRMKTYLGVHNDVQ